MKCCSFVWTLGPVQNVYPAGLQEGESGSVQRKVVEGFRNLDLFSRDIHSKFKVDSCRIKLLTVVVLWL